MFREPLKRPRLHRVQNLDLKLPHKSAQLDLCFWLQWRKKLIGSTDKEENGRFPLLFPPVLHMSLLEKRSYATKTFTNAWVRNLRLLTCDLLKGTRIWTCNGFQLSQIIWKEMKKVLSLQRYALKTKNKRQYQRGGNRLHLKTLEFSNY